MLTTARTTLAATGLTLLQIFPAAAQNTADPYEVTRDCVLKAVQDLVPDQEQKIIERSDSIGAHSATDERYMEYIVNFARNAQGALSIEEISHNYAADFSVSDFKYQFSTGATISYIGNEYPFYALGEGDYDAQAGVEAMDDRLRACLVVG